jgi:hypothetical protein
MGAAKSRKQKDRKIENRQQHDHEREAKNVEAGTAGDDVLPVGQLLAHTENADIFVGDGNTTSGGNEQGMAAVLVPQQQLSDGKIYVAHGHGEVLTFLQTPPPLSNAGGGVGLGDGVA